MNLVKIAIIPLIQNKLMINLKKNLINNYRKKIKDKEVTVRKTVFKMERVLKFLN
jgi:hypothetical protein